MMTNDDRPGKQELREEREWIVSRISQISEALDTESLNELYDYAGALAARPVLNGGPFDGYRLAPGTNAAFLYVNADRHRVALYEDDGSGHRFRFTRMKRKGEGCMPDIYPEKQNDPEGNP